MEDFNRIITIGNYVITGELGPQLSSFNGVRVEETMPRLVDYEDGVKMIASGAFHNVFIDGDDHLRSFGRNEDGQLGRDTRTIPDDHDKNDKDYKEIFCIKPDFVDCKNMKFKKVTAGDCHSVGLEINGDVYIFGNFK